MLAIAVSLLFALAAFAALATIGSALIDGSRRARAILAELGEIEHRACVTRGRAAQWEPGYRPAFAAA